MPGELRVFDPFHVPIGTIYPARAINVAFARNTVSAAKFTIPRAGLRWSTAYIRPLHLVEYHDSALPQVWIGVMLDFAPKADEVEVSCMSAEWFYAGRFTETWLQVVGSAGVIAARLQQQAARLHAFPIRQGPVDTGGPEYYVLYQQKKVSDAYADLVKMAGGDFWVEKTGHEHLDPWLSRFARTRGQDLTASVLICAEVTDFPSDQTTGSGIATALHVWGGGTGSELWQKLYLYKPDDASAQVYSVVEDVVEFPEIIDPDLLSEAGNRALATRNRPVETVGGNIDNRRSSFGSFWLGDQVRAILTGVGYAGYDGPVTVQGIQIDVDNGKMGLVVDVPQ